MKRFSRRLLSYILLVSMLAGMAIAGGVSVSALSAQVVTTDAVRLRSSAGFYDNIITVLDVEESLTLLEDSDNGWAYVAREDGTKGYCSIDYLNVPDGSSVEITGATTDDVNFREGPSTDYTSMGILDTGTEFVVVDNSDEDWVKVNIDSETGYIYRYYTELYITVNLSNESAQLPDTPNWFESSDLSELLGEAVTENKAPLVTEIALADDSITIERGSKYALAVHITGGESVQNAVEFTSSDKSIATVTQSGVVKALAVGSATITAKLAGTDKTALCEVEVTESYTEPEEDTLSISDTEITVRKGNHYQLTSNIPVKWRSSDSDVATVSNGFVTAKSTGSAVITAYTDTQSINCIVTVKGAPSGISVYRNSVSITAGKTYYNGATSDYVVNWSSSDTSVAKVQNGFITAVSEGMAIITAKNSEGVRTCLVNVKPAEPVRFAYSVPNTAAKNEKVTLYAVTDQNRTAVKFEVNVSGSTKTVEATSKVADGNTFIWSGTTTISSSGTHKVVAYSKLDGDWQTCSSGDAKTTVFVRETQDLTAETLEKRRPTDDLVSLIADFEGYSSSVYFDSVASGVATLGYGKVVYLGDSFYNDMTKKEAYAYLVQTVNEGGFASSVNNYLDDYDIKRNQHQYDALVSFVYNLGSNILAGDSDFKKIFLDTNIKAEGSVSDKDAYVNGSDVNLRKGPSTSDAVVDMLAYGTALILVETEEKDGWYHVKLKDGTEGYIYATYVTKGRLSTSDDYSLGRVDKAKFTKLLLQYHHAGSSCVWGLLNRRVDELDVFYYGEYTRNGSSNVYGYKFTCAVNSSTKL